jgi:hypothetical protein
MMPTQLKWPYWSGLFNMFIGVINLSMLSQRVFNGLEISLLIIINAIIPFVCAILLLWFVKRQSRQMIWDKLKNVTGNTPNEEGL